MGVLGKIKNFFVEEVEEDEEEEEEVREPEQEQLARKVEVPKKSFRERFKLRERLEEEEEDEEEPEKEEKKIELEEQEPNVYIPKNTNFTFEGEEINPVPEKDVTMEEEEEEFPTRSSRIPLVFEDEDLFKEEDEYNEEPHEEVEMEDEEEEPAPPPKEKFKPPLLYQGKKDSNYIDSLKKETYNASKRETVESGDKRFRPSPIISPIYGILDKNYKKDEIRTKTDISYNSEKKEKAIDNIRKKAYGEEPKREEKEEVKEKTEKKVNITKETPAVSKVTIADADEYYNDLGLAYNVDYKDMSRSQTTKKKAETKEKDDDNLFDLIDSMYNKKED